MSKKYDRENTEPHLLERYFPPHTSAHRAIGLVRWDLLRGKPPILDPRLINAAQAEIKAQMDVFNQYAPTAAHDLADYVLDGKKSSGVLVETGTFGGPQQENLESVVGSHLPNPWGLFRRDPRLATTRDTQIAIAHMEKYLEQHRSELRGLGYDIFWLKSSGFFYFDRNDLLRFAVGDGIDMLALVPLLGAISTNPNYGGLIELGIPDREAYQESVPVPIVSYRLKRSLEAKLYKRLVLETVYPKRVVKDWIAYRVVAPTEEEAERIKRFLTIPPLKGIKTDYEGLTGGIEKLLREVGKEVNRPNIRHIGKKDRTRICYIDIKDYYAKPKNNGYRAYHIFVEMSVSGGEPFLAEIQVVDRAQYYRNEVNPFDSAHHVQQQKKKRSRKIGRTFDAELHNTLEAMFGKSVIPLGI